MAAEVLKDLYKTEPASKAAIEKAAGYAIFDNMGVFSPAILNRTVAMNVCIEP